MKFRKRFFKLIHLVFMMAWAISALSQRVASEYTIDAQKLQKHGKISEAISKYRLDYQMTHDDSEAYEIAALYAISDSKDSTFAWLEIASKTDSTLSMLMDDRFYLISETPEWQAFENQQLEKYEYKNGKLKNIALAKRLWHIGMKDQAYSYEINLATRILGDTSPITKAVWILQNKNRAENLTEMETIVDKYGWPKISEVGDVAAETAFYVVQHSKGEVARKKYLPKLKKACKKKEANWTDYAAMYDRLALAETGKQLYGTQFERSSDGKLSLYPLEAPEYVEKRRKEVGLPPLAPVMERNGILFHNPQKNK